MSDSTTPFEKVFVAYSQYSTKCWDGCATCQGLPHWIKSCLTTWGLHSGWRWMKTFMQQVAHLVQVGVFLVLNCLLLKFSLTSPDSFLTNASWKKTCGNPEDWTCNKVLPKPTGIFCGIGASGGGQLKYWYGKYWYGPHVDMVHIGPMVLRFGS